MKLIPIFSIIRLIHNTVELSQISVLPDLGAKLPAPLSKYLNRLT